VRHASGEVDDSLLTGESLAVAKQPGDAVTGDDRGSAEAVARRPGIGRVEAEVLPEHKAALVGTLKAGGATASPRTAGRQGFG
jgi:cation transport ATPase